MYEGSVALQEHDDGGNDRQEVEVVVVGKEGMEEEVVVRGEEACKGSWSAQRRDCVMVEWQGDHHHGE